MMQGIDIGAKAIAVTLGYGGRTVFIYRDGLHLEATKDGVTVITSIRLKDKLADAGLKLIQEVSSKTATEVGDGTTTSAVLFHEIVTNGLMLKQSGVDVMLLKRGMDRACKAIVSQLDLMKKEIGNNKKMLRQIASVSANNDAEIGSVLGDTFDKIGKYGTIYIEDGKQLETVVELVNGFQFLGGLFSPYFINTPNNTGELINPYVLIVDGKIEKASDIMGVLEMVVAEKRPIVIMADDFDNNMAATVLTNINGNAKLKAILIKHVFIGETKDELLLDLCAITGATLITEKTGKKVSNISLSDLGECEKIVSDKDETTIFNGKNNKNAVKLRVDDANKKIEKSRNPFVKEKCEVRLSKLTGIVAICYVGGATEVEIGEKKARVDDAVRATKAAIEEGVVVGGGSALLRCVDVVSKLTWENEHEKSGINLIQKSIEKPFFQICENAGKNGHSLADKVKEKKGNYGYNAKTDRVEDLFSAGIIDPAKVVRKCVENAVSAAAQFLISECAIVPEII